jgi:hypothetical protein
MKKGFLSVIAVAAVCVTGCVGTVTEEKTAGLHLSTDKVENRYDRPLPDVYQAATRAFRELGKVERESTLVGTNKVQTIQGTVTDVDVWVRVQAIDPKVTAVTVQARTTWGGSQVAIAHQVATRIALQLVH